MIYPCKTEPITRLIVTSQGYAKPLCNTCQSRDCENPIELMDVSIAGVNEKQRVHVTSTQAKMVVQCDGYVE